MTAILAALLLVAATLAHAAEPLYVHEEEAVTIKLMPGPCVDPVVTMLIAGSLMDVSKFRGLESNWSMQDGSRKDFGGCWMEIGDELFIVFSDNTGTRITKEKFTRRKGMTGT